MVRTTTIFLALALALALAGAAASKTTGKVIAHGQILKNSHGKIALAEVNAVKPLSLTAKVSAPKQAVKIDYSVVCVKNEQTNAQGYNSSATPKTGTVNATAPASVKLPMPFAHPSSCEVAVYSILARGGKQTLELVQT